MKYYSEVLNRIFESEKELVKAETEQKEREAAEKRKKEEAAATRKARAKEVEELMNKAIEAQKEYKKALMAFNKDFGPFHFTWSGEDSILDLFNWF